MWVAGTPGSHALRRQGRAASSRRSNRSLGTGSVLWPTPALAVLVADRDRQPAGGHAVEPQLLDQPLEVADQPGVEDHRAGGRLAEGSAPRQHLVRGTPGVDRLHRIAVELPPEGLARGGQERPHQPPVGPRQVEAGGDAPGGQPGRPPPGDPGDLGHRPVGQERFLGLPVEHRQGPERLGRVGDQLGQGPRPGDAHRHRHAHPLPDPVADRQRQLLERLPPVGHRLEEELVDRVILDPRRQLAHHVEHQPAQDLVPAEIALDVDPLPDI